MALDLGPILMTGSLNTEAGVLRTTVGAKFHMILSFSLQVIVGTHKYANNLEHHTGSVFSASV
jgi:hypothetical protein